VAISVPYALLTQPGGDPEAIRPGSVLTHLPFALDPTDRNFHTDDGLHLRRHVVRRHIIDLP